MDILPAIDLRDGQVVRLQEGDYDRQTTYRDDPSAVAVEFAVAGAGWIHVVDLDAARSGRITNGQCLQAIRKALDGAGHGRVRIEFGGGIRNTSSLQAALSLGADRLVIGSAALKDWPWFEGLLADASLDNGRLALSLDARDGMCAAQGWTQQTQLSAVELAGRVRGSGLGAIVYTDIRRDGMLAGVNVEATAEVVAATDVGVVASGGVRSIDDVHACRQAGCSGVIVGRAWYEGKIDLAEACRLAASV